MQFELNFKSKRGGWTPASIVECVRNPVLLIGHLVIAEILGLEDKVKQLEEERRKQVENEAKKSKEEKEKIHKQKKILQEIAMLWFKRQWVPEELHSWREGDLLNPWILAEHWFRSGVNPKEDYELSGESKVKKLKQKVVNH